MSVVRKAFEQALKYEEYITLGGGEPTIHPRFWEIFGLALGTFEDVWLATNGSNTETTLALAKLAERGIVGVALSRDKYHDDVSPKVLEAFDNTRLNLGQTSLYDNTPRDRREIRNSEGNEIKGGRCLEGNDKGCLCEDFIIKPNGNVYRCACVNAPFLGNVVQHEVDFGFRGCYNGEDYKDYLEDMEEYA